MTAVGTVILAPGTPPTALAPSTVVHFAHVGVSGSHSLTIGCMTSVVAEPVYYTITPGENVSFHSISNGVYERKGPIQNVVYITDTTTINDPDAIYVFDGVETVSPLTLTGSTERIPTGTIIHFVHIGEPGSQNLVINAREGVASPENQIPYLLDPGLYSPGHSLSFLFLPSGVFRCDAGSNISE